MKNNTKSFFDSYVEGFDNIYNQISAETKLSSIITKFFRKSMRERFKLSINDLLNENIHNILDVGCGSGRYTNYLAQNNKKVVGIDFADKMIEFAKKNAKLKNLNNVDFLCVSLEDYKFDTSFDGVVCMGFFDYVKDSHFAVEKILKSEPKIFIGSFPKRYNILNFIRVFRYYINNCPLYYYTKNDFKIIEQKYPNYSFDYIDLGREYYIRARKK